MKRLEIKKIIESIIKEIGDVSAKSYKYKPTAQPFKNFDTYKFTTDSDLEYTLNLILEFNEEDDMYMEIEFLVNSGDYYQITNKGEMYKIMSTVIKITKDVLNKSKNKDIKGIIYSPAGLNKDDFGVKRDRLYQIFIKKQFPNATIKRIDNDIWVTF